MGTGVKRKISSRNSLVLPQGVGEGSLTSERVEETWFSSSAFSRAPDPRQFHGSGGGDSYISGCRGPQTPKTLREGSLPALIKRAVVSSGWGEPHCFFLFVFLPCGLEHGHSHRKRATEEGNSSPSFLTGEQKCPRESESMKKITEKYKHPHQAVYEPLSSPLSCTWGDLVLSSRPKALRNGLG